MDANIQRRSTRTAVRPDRYEFDSIDRGFQSQIILLPDADLSENENFSSESEDEEHNNAGVVYRTSVYDSSSGENEDDEIDDISNNVLDLLIYLEVILRMLVNNLQFEQPDMPNFSEFETAVHFFKYFFSEDMIDIISMETDKYGFQNNVSVGTDTSEIEQLLGVFIR